jgi:hypothetical protein
MGHMATDRHCDQNDGYADDENSSHECFHFSFSPVTGVLLVLDEQEVLGADLKRSELGCGRSPAPTVLFARPCRAGRPPEATYTCSFQWAKPNFEVFYLTASTAYRRTVLIALSRCGARSFQAFDL